VISFAKHTLDLKQIGPAGLEAQTQPNHSFFLD